MVSKLIRNSQQSHSRHLRQSVALNSAMSRASELQEVRLLKSTLGWEENQPEIMTRGPTMPKPSLALIGSGNKYILSQDNEATRRKDNLDFFNVWVSLGFWVQPYTFLQQRW